MSRTAKCAMPEAYGPPPTLLPPARWSLNTELPVSHAAMVSLAAHHVALRIWRPGWQGEVMHVQPVDPRDTGWEVTQPAYRVYFWQRGGHWGSGWASEEWQAEGADVHE